MRLNAVMTDPLVPSLLKHHSQDLLPWDTDEALYHAKNNGKPLSNKAQ